MNEVFSSQSINIMFTRYEEVREKFRVSVIVDKYLALHQI